MPLGGFINRGVRLIGSPITGARKLNFSLGPNGVDEGSLSIPETLQTMFAAAGTPNMAGGGASDIFRSLSAGANQANQIKTQHYIKAARDRQDDMADVEIQAKLGQSGRPVQGGMVEEDQLMPDTPGLPGGTTVKISRKVDPSRVVRHKTRDGRTLEYELYTPEEQFKRAQDQKKAELQLASQVAVNQARQIAQAQDEIAQARRKSQLEQFGVRVPKGFPGENQLVLPTELDDIMRAHVANYQIEHPDNPIMGQPVIDENRKVWGIRKDGTKVDLGLTAQAKDTGHLSEGELAYNSTDPTLPPQQRAALAFQKLQAGKRAGDKRTLAEELADLNTKRGMGTLTKADQIRMRAIQDSMAHGAGAAETPGDATLTGDAYLGTLEQGFANRVKAIVEGRHPVPTGAALRAPENQALLNAAAVYEPGFDLTQWQTRSAIRKDAATGKMGQNIRSLNTLIHHAARMMESTKALNNSGFTGWNLTANALKQHFGGNPQLRQWNLDAHAVENEAANLFKNTAATNQEIESLRQNFNQNAAIGDQVASIQEVMRLAFGRMSALRDQFENAFKKPKDFDFLTPDSSKLLREKLSLDPAEVEGTTRRANVDTGLAGPTGGGKQLTDENKAREYLQRAGGDKNKARELARQDGYTF